MATSASNVASKCRSIGLCIFALIVNSEIGIEMYSFKTLETIQYSHFRLLSEQLSKPHMKTVTHFS